MLMCSFLLNFNSKLINFETRFNLRDYEGFCISNFELKTSNLGVLQFHQVSHFGLSSCFWGCINTNYDKCSLNKIIFYFSLKEMERLTISHWVIIACSKKKIFNLLAEKGFFSLIKEFNHIFIKDIAKGKKKVNGFWFN